MAWMAALFGGGGAASYAAAAATVLGTAASIQSGRQQAAYGKSVARLNQIQADRQAKEAMAVSAMEASASRRKAQLMASRALAVGAASGAGTSGIEGILADIAAEGEKEAGMSSYEGATRAENRRLQGIAGINEAKARGDISRREGAATLLQTSVSVGNDLYSRFKDE